MPLKARPLLYWARKESPSWPYCMLASWTRQSETPKATRSRPCGPNRTFGVWCSCKAKRVSTSTQSTEGHRRPNKKRRGKGVKSAKRREEEAEKRAEERRVKREEEERMIRREDAGRIQIQITLPHSMVQKCITATTSTKEWGDLQDDAKALLAAEVEKQAAERLKERPTRTTWFYL